MRLPKRQTLPKIDLNEPYSAQRQYTSTQLNANRTKSPIVGACAAFQSVKQSTKAMIHSLDAIYCEALQLLTSSTI